MRKNGDGFIDCKHLKTCVSIIMVLDHYGWVRELKGTGNTVRSTCPIHNGSNDKQFVVNIRKNTWCCFGDCRRGGSILELVAEIEKIDIREAAVRIASWFPLSLPHSSVRSSNGMSDNQKPSHKVFVVEEREGEGKDEDAFWTRVGSAWPHKDGKGYNMQLAKSLGMGLDEAALAAISQWRFTPASQNGSPVPVVATIEVNFRLL